MTISFWAASLAYSCAIAQLVVAVGLFRRQLVRGWPSVATYCIADSATSLFLLAPKVPYAIYYHVFWSWALLGAGVRIWILFDISRSVPGLRHVALELKVFFGTLGAVLACFAWGTSASYGSIFANRLVHTAVVLNRNTAFACAALIVAFVCAVRSVGFGWTRQCWHIATGLLLVVLVEALSSIAISLGSKAWWVPSDYLKGTASLLCPIVWLLGFVPLPRALVGYKPRINPLLNI